MHVIRYTKYDVYARVMRVPKNLPGISSWSVFDHLPLSGNSPNGAYIYGQRGIRYFIPGGYVPRGRTGCTAYSLMYSCSLDEYNYY